MAFSKRRGETRLLAASATFPAPAYVTYNAADIAAKPLGGHVVHVIGFATNSELPAGIRRPAVGPGYFIIKNSWDNCFADAGYIHLDWEHAKATGYRGFSLSTIN